MRRKAMRERKMVEGVISRGSLDSFSLVSLNGLVSLVSLGLLDSLYSLYSRNGGSDDRGGSLGDDSFTDPELLDDDALKRRGLLEELGGGAEEVFDDK